MYLKGIIVSLALLCFIAGGRSEPQCSFAIPALLKSGEMVRGCLQVQYHSEPVFVNVILEVSGVNHTILSEPVPAVYTFKCPEFQVPNISTAAPVFLTISAVASNFNYTARRAVVVAPTGTVTLIQMEKSIYKAGQTVRANVIALDNNLQPVEDTYSVIYVTDSSGNRLYQWQNKETTNSIYSLSFDIPDDPNLGKYQIVVERKSRNQVSKSFDVDEYVMPNFGVTLSAPKSITIMDETLSYQVNAEYTYSQGVPGNVSVRGCRAPTNYYPGNACNRNPDGLCIFVTGVLDSNGTFIGKLDVSAFQLDRSGYEMGLKIQATVIEEGSGIQVTESQFTSITHELGRVFFNRGNMERYYKKELPCYIEVTAVDGLEKPLSDQIIELQVNGKTVKNLTTDADGKAWDFIDTSELEEPVVNIQVIYKNSEQCYDSNYIVPTYSNDFYTFTRFYSPSESFVQINGPKDELQCGQTYNFTAKYIFNKLGLKEGQTTAYFNYIVMSRTKIINFDRIQVDLTNSLRGEITFKVQINSDHAPAIDVVMYCMLEKEVMAHSIHLSTEKCFNNQVSLRFSEERAIPGSTVNLNITAAPRSLCAVRVYDSSLLLLNPDQPLTAEMVYASLQYTSLNGYYVAGYNVAPPDPSCIDPNKQILVDGVFYAPVNTPDDGDTLQELSNIGILIITNNTLKKPTLCGQPSFIGRPPVWDGGLRPANSIFTLNAASPEVFARDSVSGNPGAPAEIQSVRIFFPDTWFFNQTYTSESGSVSVPLEVPGTITGWKGDMVCLNSGAGFGMTKYPANFTAFQEFFVSDFLPYSIVRGEILIANVAVSIYLNKCAKVRATIAPSNDYTVESMDKDAVKCICFGQRASFAFSIKAKSLGVVLVNITGETIEIGDTCEGPADPNEPLRKDTLVRSIIIEAEGIPKEVTQSTLICVNDTSAVTYVNISPPGNSVKDATTAQIAVIGDILGRALVHPEKTLINEPTGCGEQVLATVRIIPKVVDYLNKTGRLTEEIKARAVLFMGIGYRQLLRYRNFDGGFSAFGNGQSSSWLTLLILDTIEDFKPYTYVDPTISNQGLVYLERLKDVTGAFKPQGTLFSNGLRGGAEDNVSFTAAMACFLLRATYAASGTLIRDTMNFLVTASQVKQSVYNTALLLKAFRMAGNEERSNAMFNNLKELQIEQEGTIHWERPSKPNKPTSYIFSPRAASAEIEITANILYALIIGSSPLASLTYLAQIVLWLTQQQDPYGAYSTTADTAVALEALSSYGALVYQKGASNSVEVKYGDKVIKEFNLDSGKRDLLQTQNLPNIPGNYSMNVKGNGCVLLQTTVKFNIPVDEEDSAFRLSIYVPPESCVNGVAYKFPVHMNLSYNGIAKQSNMVLISIALPSGYGVENHSLMELRGKVGKVEQKNNNLIIYLDSASRDTISLNVTLEMVTRVQNFQPKHVLVWDYYEKDENGIAVIHHPCSIQ